MYVCMYVSKQLAYHPAPHLLDRWLGWGIGPDVSTVGYRYCSGMLGYHRDIFSLRGEGGVQVWRVGGYNVKRGGGYDKCKR